MNNKHSHISIISNKMILVKTEVYDEYWRFATERQNIFFKRLNNESRPWSDFDVYNDYKFTNAYRASDRVSQYLIKEVIYTNEKFSSKDLVFRILLFKFFNKIETWEYIESKLGSINYSDYSFDLYDKTLNDMVDEKKRIYSAAYIMPSGKSSFGYSKKHRNNLKLLEMIMNDNIVSKIEECSNLEELYKMLLSYPTIGKFLAYQYAIDINYSEICDFDEMSFVVAGPGAVNGISKCFKNFKDFSLSDIIKYMCYNQNLEFERLNLEFKSLWGRDLQLIDCQNLFCETDKLSRVIYPQYNIGTKKKRIKQNFHENTKKIEFFYPPKWNINHLIK